MARARPIVIAALLLMAAPATAQQLENHRTEATSGTVDTRAAGRNSGANLSPGAGPASETKMPTRSPETAGRGNGAVSAGASDKTKELFQH